MILTMAAVADHKGITVDKLEVQVEPRVEELDKEMHTLFAARVALGQGLSERERRILFNAARRCEVHKLLSGQISFEAELVEE